MSWCDANAARAAIHRYGNERTARMCGAEQRRHPSADRCAAKRRTAPGREGPTRCSLQRRSTPIYAHVERVNAPGRILRRVD